MRFLKEVLFVAVSVLILGSALWFVVNAIFFFWAEHNPV